MSKKRGAMAEELGVGYEVAPGIWRIEEQLTPEIILAIHLIKADASILIDTGIATSYDTIHQLLRDAEIASDDVRLIVNTHAHHDHIGCNRRIKNETGALLVAPIGAEAWIEDQTRHVREFAFHHQDLIPPEPDAVAELEATLDGNTQVDLIVDEGFAINAGSGTYLDTFALPGHVEAEIGFFERQTGTLILGDAVTGIDWPLFHGHVRPTVYRRTLAKLRTLVRNLDVQRVCLAHYPVMAPEQFLTLVSAAENYVDRIDDVVRGTFRDTNESITLAEVWETTYSALDKEREFRGLAMVVCHIDELRSLGLVERVAPDEYRWVGTR